MQIALERVLVAPQEELARSLLEDTLKNALIKPHESLLARDSSESNDNATVKVDTGSQPTGTTNTFPSFISVCRGQRIHTDPGAVNTTNHPSSGTKLIRDENPELEKLFNVIESLQVTKGIMELAPFFINSESFERRGRAEFAISIQRS